MTTEESAEISRLKRARTESRPANEISKSASAFFAFSLNRPKTVILESIDQQREVFGVEPISRVLGEHGCAIAPSTLKVRPAANWARSFSAAVLGADVLNPENERTQNT